MADSNVNLAAPTGNADTRTAPDGDHRQVMVMGDPTAATVATVDANGLAVKANEPDAAVAGSLTATDAVVPAHTNDGTFKTGTPTANSYVAMPLSGGESSWSVSMTGTFGAGTVWIEVSNDSTNGINGNWTTALGRQSGINLTFLDEGITSAGLFRGNCSGMTYMRFRVTGATAPNVAITARSGRGPGAVFLNASIPSGTNPIGIVDARGAVITGSSNNFAAAATGSTTTVDVSRAGNVSFIVKNQIAGTAFTGSPVVVFEQSDDAVSWSPLTVVSGWTNGVASTHVISPIAANQEFVYEAALEAINYVRARVTTGTATNGMTIVTSAGSLAFAPVVTSVDRKDAGRSNVAINYNATTPPTADTLLTTLVLQKGATNTTAQTSIPVAAGRAFRITGIVVSTRATVATLPYGVLTLRVNYSGAAVLASPVHLQVAVSGSAAVIGNTGTTVIAEESLLELTGTAQLGLSFSGNLATNVVAVSILGYEYVA